MAKQSVTLTFCGKTHTFTQESLKAKALKATKNQQAPVGGLHRVTLPGIKFPVSVNWFANVILEVPNVGPNKILLEQGPKAEGAKLRGMFNPQQVLTAADKLAPLGVKAESDSSNPVYAKWSKAAAIAQQKLLAQYLPKNVKVEKTQPKRKTQRKTQRVKVENPAPAPVENQNQ